MEKLYCVVGKSGAGKTTVTDRIAAEYGMKSVASMTTRPERYPGEPGHVFVTKEEFDKHDMVAYTKFDGNEYGVPAWMLDDSDFYVIDIEGVKTLRERYAGKELVVVYLDISEEEATRRMRNRGDSEAKITKRLANDREMFSDMEGLHPDYIIDANRTEDEVVGDLLAIVNKERDIDER